MVSDIATGMPDGRMPVACLKNKGFVMPVADRVAKMPQPRSLNETTWAMSPTINNESQGVESNPSEPDLGFACPAQMPMCWPALQTVANGLKSV